MQCVLIQCLVGDAGVFVYNININEQDLYLLLI